MRLHHWTHPQKEIEYNLKSGVSKEINLNEPHKEGEPCPGFSAKEKRLFGPYVSFAIFKDENGIMFYAGSKGWPLSDQEIKFSHSRPFPFLSRFCVHDSEKIAFSIIYSHLGRLLYTLIDPTYDKLEQDADFFLEFIAENANSKDWLSNVNNIWCVAST